MGRCFLAFAVMGIAALGWGDEPLAQRFANPPEGYQPWTNPVARMAMGQRGVPFSRNAVWWEEGQPWLTYLRRCQVLMKEGVFVEDGPKADFTCEGAGLTYLHRRAGDTDIYFVNNPAWSTVSAECLFRVSGKVPEFWNAEDGRVTPAAVFKDEGGETRLPLRLYPAGSLFVLFRPGESKRHATRLVFTPAAPDAPVVQAKPRPIGDNPAYQVELEKRGPLLLAWQPGTFEITLADGRTVKKQVYEVPVPFALDGPWQVYFQAEGGAPEKAVFGQLVPWAQRAEAGIRAFSGSAVYEKTLRVPDDLMGPGRRMILDLGAVRNRATVTLNDQALGVLWKPPYVVDVTQQLKVGENALRVTVMNSCVKRLFGDEPPEAGLLGPACIRTVFELPGR